MTFNPLEFKISQKVKEICSLINLLEYNSVIEKIIRRVYEQKCQLAIYPGKTKSKHVSNDSPHCIIGLKQLSEKNNPPLAHALDN